MTDIPARMVELGAEGIADVNWHDPPAVEDIIEAVLTAARVPELLALLDEAQPPVCPFSYVIDHSPTKCPRGIWRTRLAALNAELGRMPE